MNDCIFCKIVAGHAPSHKIWENDNFIAFLSIFPNTEGVTVVTTKEHYPSYAFALPDDVFTGLMLAAKHVARLLDEKLEDVGRTALVLEGFGVDHVHAKLFPMHGTKDMSSWKPIESKLETYFEKYPGYISSHDAGKADDQALADLAKKIKE
ncbi:HIT family protein [Patescibacteria group bacterium]|nr:HIT family protein [Patescibacteria group bacterium]